MQSWSPSGLSTIPRLQWGSHLAHFFETGEDLRDVLVPYFQAGLRNNEQCLWVTGEDFSADDARSALRAAVPDLDKRERKKQIDIVDGRQWYSSTEKLRPQQLIDALLKREEDALAQGYKGQRTSGNCAWVGHHQWDDFLAYEGLVHEHVPGRRMVCICSYRTDQLHGAGHLELMERHDLALPGARRAAPPTARGRDPNSEALQDLRRSFDLAMNAAEMGTWRYTLGDNICVYDDNAQRLYGLREARFLHDEAGVEDKFHPDDRALMWERVASALDPLGDGRYDVEYRVKQEDGSWRWLSAWGLVEFEGEGQGRKAVAITGASRDLTKQKQAEDLQRLLLNEANHRVKNTVATIHAISAQTLRRAADLPSARVALEARIGSLARAHDLLTSRSWSGANLDNLVARAIEAFSPGQIDASGPAIEVSPKQALSIALALHELATNATKYGALSSAEGKVRLTWQVSEGGLIMDWQERGGPPVVAPRQRGFGSRLLEDLLARDLGGATSLDYDPEGVRCRINVAL